MSGFLQTLAISCIPAIITGIVTYLVAHKKASAQIEVVKEQNKHDLEKLNEDFKNQVELLQIQMSNNIAENAVNKLTDSIINNPEMQKKMSQAIRNTPIQQRRHK